MPIYEFLLRALFCCVAEGAFLFVVFTLLNPQKRAKIKAIVKRLFANIHMNLSKTLPELKR